jgi:hypothetical protein
MNQQEILDQIKSLLNSSEKAIIEIQKGINVDFYINLIQQNSIECFNLSNRVSNTKAIESKNDLKIEIKKPIEPVVEEVLNLVKTLIPEIEPVIIPEPIQEIKKPELIEKIENPIQEPILELEVKNVSAPVKEITVEETLTAALKAPQTIQTSKFKEEEGDDFSVNSKISKNKQPVLNFADKSTETSIPDLAKAISIGKKFEFINGLFNGNSEAYKNCIQTLQTSENYNSAINYIENEINNQFDWNENEQLAAELFALIKRRFN